MKNDHYDQKKETNKYEKALINNLRKFICTMSFSVHFRFIEKNPPDFFLPVCGGCDETGGSTDELERTGNVRDLGSLLDDV